MNTNGFLTRCSFDLHPAVPADWQIQLGNLVILRIIRIKIVFTVKLAKVIELADSGAINSTVAKEVFEEVFKHDIDPDKYVEEKGLKTVNDAGELQAVVEQVIKDNPQSVEDYRNGKEKAIGFLVGQTMKAMKGKANPGMVNKILKELL